MRKRIPIVPTRHGLNDRLAYSEQPGQTTPITQNMRTEEPATGRLRIAQRAGHVKYTPFELFRNYLSYTERFRANEQDDGIPSTLGWQLTDNQLDISVDGTLAPNDITEVELLTQVPNFGSARSISQFHDAKQTGQGPSLKAHPGATYLRGSSGTGADIVFSVFLKNKDALQSRVILRQSNNTITPGDGLPLISMSIDWTLPSSDPNFYTVAADSGTETDSGFFEEGNDWYRFWLKIQWETSSESTSSLMACTIVPNDSDTTARGIYAWAAQVEAEQTEPRSYEPVERGNDLEGKRKVANLRNLAYAQRPVNFRELDDPALTFTEKTPNELDAVATAIDRQNARYVVEGPATVLKYTKDWKLVYEIAIPLVDDSHRCRALHIDQGDCIYVAVSEGGDQKTARLWKYLQGPEVNAEGLLSEESFHLAWFVDTEAYVYDLAVREDSLYTLQADVENGVAYVVVYGSILSIEPEEILRYEVPYPSHGLSVKSDSTVVVCAPSNGTRGVNPKFPNYAPRITSWEPSDYETWDEDGWCWLDDHRINGVGTSTKKDYEQGDSVDRWVDLTGKGRDLYKPLSRSAPTVNFNSGAGLVGIRMNGTDQALESLPNPDTILENKELQRTLWPAYAGAKYTCFVAFTPAIKGTQGCVIGQENEGTGSGERALVMNRASSGSVSNPVQGALSHYDPATAGQPASGTVSDGTAVATIIVSASAGESIFDINGASIQAGYASDAVLGTSPTGVGFLEEESGFGFFEGDIHEIIVVDGVVDAANRDRFVSYLCYKRGIDTFTSTSYQRPTSPSTLDKGTNAPIKPEKPDPNPTTAESTVVAKYDPRGDLMWTFANWTGVGYDIVEQSDGNLISLGEFREDLTNVPTNGDNFARRGYLRKIIDNGDTASIDDVLDQKQHNLVGLESGIPAVSEEFASGLWVKTNVTVTSNVATAPDGAMTADRLDPTVAGGTVAWGGGAGNGWEGESQTIAGILQDGRDYVFSVFLKEDGGTQNVTIDLDHRSGTTLTTLTVDITDGSFTLKGSGPGNHDANVVDAGNGWYRAELAITFDESNGNGELEAVITPDGDAGTESVLAWGAMLEQGNTATDYYSGEIVPYANLFPRMAVDTLDNVFVPAVQESGSSGKVKFSTRIYDKDLILLHHLNLDDSGEVQGVVEALPLPPPDYTEVTPGVQRNLATFTNSFDEERWVQFAVIVSPNDTVSPSGELDATEVLDDFVGGGAGFIQLLSDSEIVKNGVDYTFSIYLRNNDATKSLIAVGAEDLSVFTSIEITWNSDGSPTTLLGSAGPGTHTFEFEQAANGFWRFVCTVTYAASGGDLQVQVRPETENVPIGTGLWAWGAQFEANSQATAYQAVVGSTPLPLNGVTMDADIAKEFMMVSPRDDIEGNGKNLPTLCSFDLVAEVPNNLPTRVNRLLGVEKGSIKIFSPTAPFQVLPGGSSALQQNARYISATTLFQKYFATDACCPVVYDPVRTGRVSRLEPERGEIPDGAELLTAWRGRLIHARTKEDPHAWFAAAIENPFDYDYFTPPFLSTQAVFHASSRAGLAPDFINSICPYDEERLILGCDHALWYLQGDPLAGGTWQLLSDITGMGYGNKAWTKDPNGYLYFVGARGGFYVMAPGQKPERLSENTVERNLTDIDFDTYYVELEWNWRAEGIHFYVIPFGSGGTVVDHFFWGRRVDEWRRDSFSSSVVQPTATVVIDGPLPRDRIFVMATEDERLLEWSETSKDDDDALINSRELFGPFRVEEGFEVKFDGVEVVLATALDGASMNLYAADNPEVLGAPKRTRALTAGRNPRKLARVRGSSVWMELQNDQPGESFAFENGGWFFAPGGRTRKR